MTKNPNRRGTLWFVLSVAVLGLIVAMPVVSGYARVQTDSVSSSQEQPAQAEQQSESPGQELAQESREAAGEDSNEHFKHSPAVQWVARMTGLSTESAFWLSFILNFAVIAVAILWASKKNLPGMFRARTHSIQKGMEEARRASEEANRRLADVESRLSRLDSEIASMREAAEREIATEEAHIKQATDHEMRRIVENAEQEIAAAAKSARRELTAYAADLAVTLAQKQIHVDTGTDQKLVRNFVQQLGDTNGSKGGAA